MMNFFDFFKNKKILQIKVPSCYNNRRYFYLVSQECVQGRADKMLQKYTQMVAVTKCTITKNKKFTGECRCLQLTNWFRKPRKSKVEKSKSPALNVGYNSHKKFKQTFLHHKNVVLQLVLEQ